MNRLVTLAGLAACTSGQQFTAYKTESGMEVLVRETDSAITAPLSCVAVTSVKPSNSPAEILLGVKDCVQQGKYAQAAALTKVGSVYSFYDTKRVADTSGHDAFLALLSYLAPNALAPKTAAMSEAEAEQFGAALEAQEEDSAKQAEICSFLLSSSQPTYMPQYMISHGMDAFSKRKRDPIVPDFDPDKSWREALAFAGCPGS